MQGDQHPTLVLLRKTRERVLEQLSDAFTKDLIGLDEFEKRVDEAYSRRAPDELLALVSDLTPLAPAGAGNALVATEGAIAEVEPKPARPRGGNVPLLPERQ